MRMVGYLAVVLVVLSVVMETESSSDTEVRSSAHAEPIRRRGILGQRGRRKTIWSYNPGHRSLAFLVAGEVEVVTPPPGDQLTGPDFRCLGCCGDRAPFGSQISSVPEPSNRVGRMVLRPDGLAVIGAEPNSVNDRCLGCCEDHPTPTYRVTTVTESVTTAAHRVMKVPSVGRQQPRQEPHRDPYEPPCVPPKCDPNWRFESSSSSEEMSMVRRPPPRRIQPIRSRMDIRCRHLGCRSPLGSVVDDSSSSSSEED